MRRILIIGMVLWCAGCGNQQSNQESQAEAEAISTNHGFGWSFDYKSDTTGLRVRNDRYPPIPLSDIERFLTEVEASTGHVANGPLIIWTNYYDFFRTFGDLTRGATYSDTGTIVVDDTLQTNPFFACLVLKHEFVHWIMWDSGANRDIQAHEHHTLPEFSTSVNCQ